MLRPLPDRLAGPASASAAVLTFWSTVTGSEKRQRASQFAGFAAVMIAAAAVVGLWASLPLLSSWGSIAMSPITALSLAALGLALMHPGKESRFAFAIGLGVVAIAALDFGINRWLWPQVAIPALEAGWLRSGSRMPLATAIVAGSLALSRFERYHFTAIMLTGLGGVMAVFALITYLAGIDTLRGTVQSPGLPTAVGMLCVAVGIVLRIGMMPALHKARPLSHLLIALACAIIVPLLLLAVYTGFRITDAQLDQARKDLLSEAQTLSAEVDHEIIGEIGRLQALASSPPLRQGDFAMFQGQAETLLALGHSGNIILIDRNMQQLVNTRVPFGTPLEKTAIAEPVERVLATGKPGITGLFTGPMTKQLMFAIVVPVQTGGENRYALVRSINQHVLADLVAAHQLPPGWHAVISDAARHVVARSEQEEDASIGQELPPTQWRNAESGVFESTDSEGRPSLEAYAWSELTSWKTTLWEPKALLEAPVRALWRTIGLTVLLAFTLVVGLALGLGRIIARSVGYTERAAIALGKGGPLPFDETPVAEVNTLMTELRGSAAMRRAAEQELQAGKDRLQLAFDATHLGWWQYDPRRATALVDARFKEIFGMTADEIPIEDISQCVHPDDRERFQVNCEAAIDPTSPKPYIHHEYRVRRRDGTVRWVEGNALAYFEGAAPQRRLANFGGTVQDITERKEREEKEHLLMREINHRAKNTLSVVHAIARQTATTSPGEFVERFSGRVQALSANQDLLVRNEWNGVEIAELVRAQLAHFAKLIGSRITVQGPKLRLNPASAQAIGLALHELATNAGKYGSLSTDTGRVDISWETGDGTFTMSWTERDGPPVSVPERRGFGTIVMEATAERSVDGKVQLDYAPTGLIWRLTCPTANVLGSDSAS
jgi:PAS domain S-box-containing protein